MTKTEILMDFDEQDNPVISVKGVKGKACKALTAELERKLGNTTSVQETAEYREREVARQNERASNKR